MPFDFSGYATKNNVRCSDGRTISRNAFLDNDGQTVPLVWQHRHDAPENVIGHAELENRPDGVYAYGYFNNTQAGKHAKELVKNGDINSLSIYANHLIEKDGCVTHGSIKEVSLVLAGANPGAFIDNIAIQHSDGGLSTLEDEAIIFTDAELAHADEEKKEEAKDKKEDKEISKSDDEKTAQEIFDSLTDKQKEVAYFLIGQAIVEANSDDDDDDDDDDDGKNSVKHSDVNNALSHADGDETVGSIWKTFTEPQKNIVMYLMTEIIKDSKTEVKHSDEGGNYIMKHNVFEANEPQETTLSHDDLCEIVAEAKKTGSLKEAFLSHADYGVENLGLLFPDDQMVNKKIEMLRNNPIDWVSKVMSGVHKSPFSRIKMLYTDLTADEARARGYVKGNKKVSEVISLAKRVVSPTTVYKMQKLDRDDIIDITDMDIVAWLKAEMRIMLEEELARAYLVGDGRLSTDTANKINESNIIPILKDYSSDLYAIRHPYAKDESKDEYSQFIDECVMAMIDYEGTGSPTLFTTPEQVAHMLLVKDSIGNRIYKTKAELANAMGVRDIIEVPYMKNKTVTNADSEQEDTMSIPTANGGKMIVTGIIVNLADYTVGADKGGAVNMFDDFDIDFNQYKYLIETRCSGALTKPHSALLIGTTTAAG